jgi:hypothetical protein
VSPGQAPASGTTPTLATVTKAPATAMSRRSVIGMVDL